jgi:hypothetical protein
MLSIALFCGCATGQNASEKINEQDDNGILEITSEPSGAFIEVLEDEDISKKIPGKALTIAGAVVPILAIPGAILSNPPAIFEDIIIFSANPVHIVLKPIK